MTLENIRINTLEATGFDMVGLLKSDIRHCEQQIELYGNWFDKMINMDDITYYKHEETNEKLYKLADENLTFYVEYLERLEENLNRLYKLLSDIDFLLDW